MDALVRAEAGVVLKTCFRRTRIPSAEKVDSASRLMVARMVNQDVLGLQKSDRGIRPKAGQGYVVPGVRNVGASGRVWLRGNWRTRSGAPAFILTHAGGARTGNVVGKKTMAALSNASSRYHSGIRQQIPAGRKTMGLAKQSWLQIAGDLGIDLSTVKGGGTLNARELTMAKAASGRLKPHKNGSGYQMGSGYQTVITLVNALPYGVAMGLHGLLRRVLAGRIKQFETLVRKGYFNDMSKIAKAFPNLGIDVR